LCQVVMLTRNSPAPLIRCAASPEGSLSHGPTAHAPGAASVHSELFIYFTIGPARDFPCLLFQTRYGAICFAKRPVEDGVGSVFRSERGAVFFSSDRGADHKPPGYYTLSFLLASENSFMLGASILRLRCGGHYGGLQPIPAPIAAVLGNRRAHV